MPRSRRGAGAAFALAAAVAAWTPAGTAGAQATFEGRMTTVVPEVTTIYQSFSVRFAELAGRLTGGRVKITPYPVGVIAPPQEVFDAVQSGLADLGHAPLPLLTNRYPETALFSSFPGGLGTEGLMHWMYEGGGKELLEEYMEEKLGLHPLIVGFSTTELFAHSHVPLKVLADFGGVKFRTLGIFAEILEGFGATPTSTPTTEVVPALTQRAIDAAEFFPPSDNVKLGLHRIAKYVVGPGAHLPGGYFVVFMRTETWQGLDEEVRRQLEMAAELTSFESWLELGKADIDAMAEMAMGDNEIIRLDDEVIAAIKAGGRAWAAKVGAAEAARGNPWVERVAAAHFGFQDRWDAFKWYRM
jgi:TRAP-type mannitol/chloroaromatic compound transport system substrate-binding protein